MAIEGETDPDLESELRQTAGREWVEEAAEDESLTELMRRRRMAVADQLRQAVEQGRRARFELEQQTFAGEVIFSGADYAVLERSDDLVAIRHDAGIWFFEPPTGEGHQQMTAAATMKAHLSELAATGESVRTVVGEGKALVGTVALVAEDHIEIDQDAVRVIVPYRQLAVVIRPRPRF